MANPNKGNIARTLAAAPLAGSIAVAETPLSADAPSTAMGAALADALIASAVVAQAESIKPVSLPFKLVGFKLNGKAKDYPGDDDPTVISRKVAFAVLGIGDSGFRFQASIYRVSHTSVKNDKGQVKVVTRCTMPNGGKMAGFKSIIETDDAREQRALDEFRHHLASEFKAWQKATQGVQAAVSATGTSHSDDVVDFE